MRLHKETIEASLTDKKNPYVFCEALAQDCEHWIDFPMEFMTVFIACRGEVTYTTRGHTVTAGPNHVQFFMKDASLSVGRISPDYRSKGIIFSKNYWHENLTQIHPYLNLAIVNPALEVTPAQRDELAEYFHSVKALLKTGLREDSPVIRAIFRGMFTRLGQLYQEWAGSYCRSSESLLFVDFCELLFNHYKSERTLDFYSEALGISAASLSTRIKRIVGYPALACIMNYTIVRLCAELGSTSKSIKELAIEYHFSDSSHLCKFFRTYVGESPTTYRKQVHQVNL